MPMPTNVWEFMHMHPWLTCFLALCVIGVAEGLGNILQRRK